MFVGHYAAALAATAAEPKAPIWTTVAACQLVDIGWSVFVIAGIERASIDPNLLGSTLVLEHMPWTHSLPMTFVWAIGAALLARLLLKTPLWASVVIGLAVASHWLLDLLVHRPDLELWFGGEKVGLGLWNYPVAEQAVEMGLLAIAALAWGASRKAQGRTAWPAALFVALLVTLQIAAMISPTGTEAGPLPQAAAIAALVVYLIVIGLAALCDLGGKRA